MRYRNIWISEAYSHFCQISGMEHFAKKVKGWKPLTIFCKKLHLKCLIGFWKNIMIDIILVLHLTTNILKGNIPVLKNFWEVKIQLYSTDMYLFKNIIGSTKGVFEICSKLTLRTWEQRHWCQGPCQISLLELSYEKQWTPVRYSCLTLS